jgi:hypothetical protein
MFVRFLPTGALAVALMFAAALVRGESYNEAVFGDLSSEPAFPSPLPLSHTINEQSSNTLTGAVGGGDLDFLLLTVPEYHTWTNMMLTIYSGSSQSFAGLQTGDVWTAGVGGAINPASLLGWTHFGPAAGASATVGQDLLDNLAIPKNGSAGFSVPLGPGQYVLLLQDTGGVIDYRLRMDVDYDGKPAGDFNGDFRVNAADLAEWQRDIGPKDGSDADGDGDTDGNDFLVWQRNVGRDDFGLTATPEPASAGLAASAALALLAAQRRRRSSR